MTPRPPKAKPDRTPPPPLPGFCDTCGYPTHAEGDFCAVWPCYRCLHRAIPGQTGSKGWKQRSDRSRGYLPAEYLDCPCGCHKAWRKAWDALDDKTPRPTVEAERQVERVEAIVMRAKPAAEHDWS